MSPPVKVHTAQTSEEEVRPALLGCVRAVLTPRAQKNIEIVKEYMKIAYSPKDNTGRDSVKHLVASDATFAAPTTFPECHTPCVPPASSIRPTSHPRRIGSTTPIRTQRS
jgi:hypothetical protein